MYSESTTLFTESQIDQTGEQLTRLSTAIVLTHSLTYSLCCRSRSIRLCTQGNMEYLMAKVYKILDDWQHRGSEEVGV